MITAIIEKIGEAQQVPNKDYTKTLVTCKAGDKSATFITFSKMDRFAVGDTITFEVEKQDNGPDKMKGPKKPGEEKKQWQGGGGKGYTDNRAETLVGRMKELYTQSRTGENQKWLGEPLSPETCHSLITGWYAEAKKAVRE